MACDNATNSYVVRYAGVEPSRTRLIKLSEGARLTPLAERAQDRRGTPSITVAMLTECQLALGPGPRAFMPELLFEASAAINSAYLTCHVDGGAY